MRDKKRPHEHMVPFYSSSRPTNKRKWQTDNYVISVIARKCTKLLASNVANILMLASFQCSETLFFSDTWKDTESLGRRMGSRKFITYLRRQNTLSSFAGYSDFIQILFIIN